MTKNHILIRSAVLGLILSFSSWANAQEDQVLVVFFDQFYAGQTLKCPIEPGLKSVFAKDVEEKCLIRVTVNREGGATGSFVYKDKFKDGCSATNLKAYFDARIEGVCKAKQAATPAQTGNAAAQGIVAAATGSKPAGTDVTQAVKDSLPQALAVFDKSGTSKPGQTGQANNGGSQGGNEGSGGKGSGGVNNTPTTSKGGSVDTTNNAISAIKPNEATTTPVTMKYNLADGSGYVEATTGPDGLTKLVQKDKVTGEIVGIPKVGVKPEELKDKFTELKVDPKDEGKVPLDPEMTKAAGNLPNAAKGVGQKAVDGDAKPGADAILAARKTKATEENTAIQTKITAIKAKIDAAAKSMPAEANAKCNGILDPTLKAECVSGLPQTAITCVETEIKAIEAEQKNLIDQKVACSTSSAEAEKLCSMVRSEKAQQVQQLMSIGFTVLSKVTAASESCGTTSTLSKVAQGGMLVAQGACSVKKFSCDASCASAQKTMELMKAKVMAMQKCQLTLQSIMEAGTVAKAAIGELAAVLETETKTGQVPQAITQCQKHSADIAQMGMAALGFLSAAQDAQKCQEQLAAGAPSGSGSSTSGLASPSMTTADFCAMPANASSITCKCTADPNAEGCLGNLAKSGIALGKVNAGAGASGFASAGQNGLGSLASDGKTTGSSGEPEPGAGLSAAAREALGMGTAASSSGGGSTGAAQFGSSAVDASKAKSKPGKEESKFSFFSGLGSALGFGSKKPDQAAKAAIRTYEQEEAIKRKIASEKIRAEITTASGKSNFDKIKNAYQSNGSSFEQ